MKTIETTPEEAVAFAIKDLQAARNDIVMKGNLNNGLARIHNAEKLLNAVLIAVRDNKETPVELTAVES